MQDPEPDHAYGYHAHGWHGPWMGRPPGSGGSRHARLWLPVVFSLIVQLPAVFFIFQNHTVVVRHQSFGQLWLPLFLALVGPLALIAARRFPGPVVAVVTAAASVDLFVGEFSTTPPYVALAFAIFSAVVRGARLWAWISLATGWVLTLTVALLTGTTWEPARVAATTLGILIVLGIAESARTRRESYAQRVRVRAQRQQSEVQAERVRIARELHDVLAHSLSQINVQAGVGLHLMDNQPEKARDALASIKETSKTALDEVRSVLGVLRADADAPLLPEPNLRRMDGLAASVTAQGVTVKLSGTPADVPQATQLAMYRIVQESLTNVLRHSGATAATVELAEEGGFYTVHVTDNGTAPASTEDTEGRGLLGMRERAELLGGTLEAGRAPNGGFRVWARIPVRSRVGAE